MQCVTWKPLILLFINSWGLPTVSFSTFPYLFVFVNIFFNFLIFYSGKQQTASRLIGETTDVGYGSLLPILFLSRLVDSTILLMDLSLVDAWLYFPGLKVGQI